MRSSRSFASMVIIDGGPVVTDNINPPNVVSVGNPSSVLTLTLPSLVDRFGFGCVASMDAVSHTEAAPRTRLRARRRPPYSAGRLPMTRLPRFVPDAAGAVRRTATERRLTFEQISNAPAASRTCAACVPYAK